MGNFSSINFNVIITLQPRQTLLLMLLYSSFLSILLLPLPPKSKWLSQNKIGLLQGQNDI